MYAFLLPLLLGFALNVASAFTTAYSRRWGERGGQLATLILRVFLGMPLWIFGLILAMRASSPRLFSSNALADALGWLSVAAGCALMVWALRGLGVQAAMPSVRDTLREQGAYAHMRHPIYSGMLLEFAGPGLLTPTLPAVIACLLGVGWILVQARLEEIDLVQRIPAYREYMGRAPRFLPRLR